MKLYNSLSKIVEEFIPNNYNDIKMYTCGPTVYHYAHIGNLRTYIVEDLLEKSLIYNGYKVNRVMNITDVGHLTSDADSGEDKMLRGAKRENKSVLEIAKYYTDCFKNDCEKLNIKWPNIVVPATSLIDDYISFIKSLEEKGYTYFKGGNVYFDTSKLKDYYKLTNDNSLELLEAVRSDVEVDSNKNNNADFVLWFTQSKFEKQALKWNSPWGIGYPGWHIECSGIALKYLGENLDIHCGGVDNKFPHHTNEIAQSESYLGHTWCKYWFHVEHLNDKDGKMSKSKGDFLTVNKLIDKGYDPIIYRFFCLLSHYRKTLDFSFEALDGAKNAYNKLKSKVQGLVIHGNNTDVNKILYYSEQFKNFLNDDLNSASAITVLYDVLKDTEINDETKLYIIKDFDSVLSLDLTVNNDNKIDEDTICYINKKIEERNNAKINKDYILADSIRDELLNKGILLKDTRDGVIYEIK